MKQPPKKGGDHAATALHLHAGLHLLMGNGQENTKKGNELFRKASEIPSRNLLENLKQLSKKSVAEASMALFDYHYKEYDKHKTAKSVHLSQAINYLFEAGRASCDLNTKEIVAARLEQRFPGNPAALAKASELRLSIKKIGESGKVQEWFDSQQMEGKNMSFDVKDYECFNIGINENTTASDLTHLKTHISSLSSTIEHLKIQVHLKPSDGLDAALLKEFVAENKAFIHQLDLTQITLEEQVVEELLEEAPNLQILSVKSDQVSLENLFSDKFRPFIQKLKTLDLSSYGFPENDECMKTLVGVIESDLPLLLRLKLLSVFPIGGSDRKEIIQKIAEKDINLFFENLHAFEEPNEAFLYYCETLSNKDFETFRSFITKEFIGKILNKVKDRPTIKKLFVEHINAIHKDPLVKDLVFSMYPPHQQGNAILYPLIIAKVPHNNMVGIQCALYTPKEEPQKVLKELMTIVSALTNPPQLFVKYYGERGIDAGGLRRQFISLLIEGLLDKHSSFPLVKGENGKYLPAPTNSSEDVIELGNLLFFLLKSPQAYPIGEVFDPVFYALIYRYATTPKNETSVDYLNGLGINELFAVIQPLIDNDSENGNEQTLQTLALTQKFLLADDMSALSEEEIGCLNNTFSYELSVSSFTEDKKTTFEWFKKTYVQKLAAIYTIAETLEKKLDGAGISLDHYPPEAMIKKIEGELSKELLIQAFTVTGPEEISQKAKRWFNEWIADKEISQLRNFVFQITGSRALIGEITFEIDATHKTIFAHSCFSKVDVPADIQKEGFITFLDQLSTTTEIDFNAL